MAATQPIRDKRQVQRIISHYNHTGNLRNHLLILVCVHTALRISDVLRLTWADVTDTSTGHIRGSISLTEKKTGKSKIIALHPSLIKALEKFKDECFPELTEQLLQRKSSSGKPLHVDKRCLESKSLLESKPLFENKRTGKAISRVQAYRIIRAAADAVSVSGEEKISCHSLRKTFGYHAWKNGVSPAVIMEIFNHSSFAVTRRYLGVAQDDKNKVYLGLDFVG